MYMILCKPEKTIIPCGEVCWITDDLYKCVISREENDVNKYTNFVAKSRDIFEIPRRYVLNELVKSIKVPQESLKSFDLMAANFERDVELWTVYKGGILRDLEKETERCFVQFDIPEDILTHKDFIFVNDPIVPFGRIKVRPTEYPKPSKVNYKTSSIMHERIMRYIGDIGPATTYQIAEGLRIPISSASGRISELVRDGKLKCVNHDFSTGNQRKMWGAIYHATWI